MTNLVMPSDGPRVPPLGPDAVNALVRSEYDKTVRTWGIPNNLVRTMGWHPGLALTEVDYANSFIFDEDSLTSWPNPNLANTKSAVLYPVSGFIDRVTKELVINLVSLINRSRYSITHHTVIGLGTLSAHLSDRTQKARAQRAEEMLLHLVDAAGKPAFENRNYKGAPLYSDYQVRSMRLALKLQGDAHDVTDAEIDDLRRLMRADAKARLAASVLGPKLAAYGPAYLDAYVNSMLVEMTWCIVHFAGLLNKWFTVLKVMDESDEKRDGVDFVGVYNKSVPERIKIRNNALLGPTGWG